MTTPTQPAHGASDEPTEPRPWCAECGRELECWEHLNEHGECPACAERLAWEDVEA